MLPEGGYMKNQHMTKEMRDRIEKGIREKESLKDIAKAIDKDPTTVSKEVKRNRSDFIPTKVYVRIPECALCAYYDSCKIIKICDLKGCTTPCKWCKRILVKNKCSLFKKATCKRLTRFPYVCNGCEKRAKCKLAKYDYIPVSAHNKYEKTLHECRQGLNLTADEFKTIDNILKTGSDKGQSINIIVKNNPEMNISIKTAYNYVNSGNFQVKHNDLPNYMNNILKKRKALPKEYDYQENVNMNRKGREYFDYLLYVDQNQIFYHGELDCVGIVKDYPGALLTVVIPKWSFLLLYKLEIKDMAHVNEKIDFIYNAMGVDLFCKYLGVLLTDRGPEFNDYHSIEMYDGIRRCKLFYCDSGQSTQKPYVERVNREIRRYVFKGQSCEKLTQEDCDLIASNINNMTLRSLDDKTPYQIAKAFLGEETLTKLNIKYIDPKEIEVKNIDLLNYQKKKSK